MALEQLFLALVQSLGYFGAVLMGFLSSATLFLPTPSFLIVFVMATPQFGFHPALLGLAAGFGAALGEMIGYGIGVGGERLALNKHGKLIKKIEESFERYRAEVIIFVFAATPLPFDVIGLFCGVVRYPAKKFFIATLLGKIVKYSVIAYAGFYGMGWISNLFGIK